MTLLLSQRDLTELLKMEDALPTVEMVLRAHGEGRVMMPPKITLDLGELGNWPKYNAYINAMPAYVGPLDAAGIKWAGGFWENAKKGLPSIVAMILITDPRTGNPLAVMDGAYITALRTGAVTAIGAKYLSRKNSSIIGIVGAGIQARYQLKALNEELKIEEVRVNDRNERTASEYVHDMHEMLGLNLKKVATVEKAALGADVVVTVTTSKEPFLRAEWIGSGALVASLGSYQEVYPEVPKKADKIVVDNLQQVKHRGSLKSMFDSGVLVDGDIYAEIGEIVALRKRGRETNKEIILFVPIGMGSEDVALAFLAFSKAQKAGLGEDFSFS